MKKFILIFYSIMLILTLIATFSSENKDTSSKVICSPHEIDISAEI